MFEQTSMAARGESHIIEAILLSVVNRERIAKIMRLVLKASSNLSRGLPLNEYRKFWGNLISLHDNKRKNSLWGGLFWKAKNIRSLALTSTPRLKGKHAT